MRGYTIMVVLALIATVSLGMAAAGPAWTQAAQRERELELLRIGTLYAQAIEHYHASAPGNLKLYPPALNELVKDSRYVGAMRHLRKLYPDPIDPSRPWGVVLDAQQRIIGVYSTSDGVPLMRKPTGFPGLPPARRYSDWKFIARDSS